MRKPGYLVELEDGRLGRTFHNKGLINGKVPVYIGKDIVDTGNGVKVPRDYETDGILVDPKKLKVKGMID